MTKKIFSLTIIVCEDDPNANLAYELLVEAASKIDRAGLNATLSTNRFEDE